MDWSGTYATISFEFLKLDIAESGRGYCEDKLQIISDKDLSTKVVDDICGNTLPPKITHKVEFPVTLRFISDIDHRQHRGFKLDYKVQFESGELKNTVDHYGPIYRPLAAVKPKSTNLEAQLVPIRLIGLAHLRFIFRRRQELPRCRRFKA